MVFGMHPWRARLAVGLIMLLLAFLGLIVTDVESSGGWNYWLWVVPVYTILALWLSWYLRHHSHSLSLVSIWHEILHWVILGLSVVLVSTFVQQGIMGRFIAGLVVLTLLTQSVFLAGIYIDTTFLAIGVVLGLFAWIVSSATEYLYAFALPLLFLGGAALAWFVWRAHKNLPKI